MPQLLTTSKSPGDFATDGPYTHVKIVRFTVDLELNMMLCYVRYGKMVESQFVESQLRYESIVEISGQNYLDVINIDQGATYTAVKAGLYAAIGTINPSFAGTMV